MNNTEQHLPSSKQLAYYRYLRATCSQRPEDVSETDRSAFCDLLLGLDPDEFEAGDIDLLQKFAPEKWTAYCEAEWGTPEEQQALKDDELLARGWERGPDGEMYVPFP